ncbi:MAG: sulfotransferase domain-containing protein [Henriciella sp.]
MTQKTSSPQSSDLSPPDIVVIGAMRAGTTTLYEMLRETGLVSVPRMKETDFFLEKQFSRGLQWLNNQYSDFSKPLVDMSPNYTRQIIFPGVAKRIYETNPNAKLVYILRDPVKRAVSEYRHGTAMGYDLPTPDELYQNGDTGYECSRYFDQLQPYLKYWSIDDIHIIEFEDLVTDQWGTLAKLFKDLGLPDIPVDREDLHTNSADDLQRVPSWWGQIRNQPLVEWVRSKTPRDTVTLLKSIFFRGKTTDLNAIKFSDRNLQTIRESLIDDVAALRALTGRSFSRWEI